MTSVAEKPDSARTRRRAPVYELEVARNEKVASGLIAVVIFILTLVVGMFIVWLTNQILVRKVNEPIQLVRARGGDAEAFGQSDDLQPPGVEEVPDLSPPTLEDTVRKITELAGRVSAQTDNPDLAGTGKTGGSGRGGQGRDIGIGDGGDVDAVPVHQRFKLKLEGLTRKEYAARLNHFKIALAVFDQPNDSVIQAGSLTAAKPARLVRPFTEFHRLNRFKNEPGTVTAAYDRELLALAGIKVPPGQIPWLWFPKGTILAMETAEGHYMKQHDRTLVEVRRTIFDIRRAGAEYEFVVIDQAYRKVK